MRHVLYLNGTRKVYDGQLECPFVVIGQRDEARHRPEKPGPLNHIPSKVEADDLQKKKYEWAQHQRKIASGYFAKTTIEWCETAEEAAQVAARFVNAGWINVEIRDDVEILGAK